MVRREAWQYLYHGDGAGAFILFEILAEGFEAREVFADVGVGITVSRIDEAATKEGIGKNDEVLAFGAFVFEPLPQGVAVGGGGKFVHAFFVWHGELHVDAIGQQGWVLGVARAAVEGHECYGGFLAACATACKGGGDQGRAQEHDEYRAPFFHGNLSLLIKSVHSS